MYVENYLNKKKKKKKMKNTFADPENDRHDYNKIFGRYTPCLFLYDINYLAEKGSINKNGIEDLFKDLVGKLCDELPL